MEQNDAFLHLIEECFLEKRKSQRALYEKFYGYGMSISLRYSNNRRDATEILNDSFLKVFTNLKRYDKSLPFKAWLRRIIINTSIDHFRKNERSVHQLTNDVAFVDTGTDIPVDHSIDVLPLLQKISPQYRIVFNLYVMEEYKHNEISEMLSISEGTSRSNLLRAKAKLKELIIKQYEENKTTATYGRFLQKY